MPRNLALCTLLLGGIWLAGCTGVTLRLDGPGDPGDDDTGDDDTGDDDTADDDTADDDTGDDDAADDDTGDDDTGQGNQPPTAVIDGPAVGWCGEPMVFDASASNDPDGDAIVSWYWAASTGETGNEETFELTVANAGEVEISLEVWDEYGLFGTAQQTLAVAEHGDPQWTLLVYLNADNNLEEAGLEDVNEMELVGSTAEVNVVVQIDRHQSYTSDDGDWTGARRYYVTQDADMNHIASPLLDDLGEVDMGDPQTAVDFLTWGAAAYPAERYAMVFWDHGDGWSMAADGASGPGFKGFSSDDQSGHEISVAEGDLADLLEQVTSALGQPIDLLGFDACLMQMWEVAHVAEAHADVLVGSEDSEGLDGWEYTEILTDLTAQPTMEPATLGDSIALHFVEQGSSSQYPTQSAVDLAELGVLTAAMDDLATVVLSKPASVIQDVADIAAQTTAYSWMPHRDLAEFAERLGGVGDADVEGAAEAVRQAVDAAVVANHVNQGIEGNGIAVYLPSNEWWESYDADYHDGAGATWAQDTSWDEMLQVF